MSLTLDAVLHAALMDGSLVDARIHQPVKGNSLAFTRVEVRPVTIRGALLFQFTFHEKARDTHKNVEAIEAVQQISSLINGAFRQAQICTTEAIYNVTAHPDGTTRIRRHAVADANRLPQIALHDRSTRYLLPEGVPCGFLHRLGIMTEAGEVISSKRAKFRQINRFLEMVADVVVELPSSGSLTVIDYGSGKSYLTFALHHYLSEVLQRDVSTTGIDRRADVTSWSNTTAEHLCMTGLQFVCGPISAVHVKQPVHLAVSLHACDTATDEALASAVVAGARVILAAPCCQHELRRQLNAGQLESMLEYGIMRERLTELVTDTLRARLLAACGYKVQILEFIESEHTPRNILIRAVKRSGIDTSQAMLRYRELANFWNATIAMEPLLARLGVLPQGD